MQSTRLQHFHERLLRERQQLVNQRDQSVATIQEETHPPGETEAFPCEGVDVEIALDQFAASRYEQISAALEMINQGTFGTCSQCGREISDDRLQEIPSALRCVHCEESRDHRFNNS